MYFAVGDAHGNITFWEFSNNPERRKEPVFLIRSDNFDITIEDIQFSKGGEFMIAVTNKRFFILVVFDDFKYF